MSQQHPEFGPKQHPYADRASRPPPPRVAVASQTASRTTRVRRVQIGILGAIAAASLSACGLGAPSLNERAVAAAEKIEAAFEEEEAALAEIEARQAEVQSKMDAAEAKARPAEDAYMNEDTDEMKALREESEQLYDAAEDADDAWFDADWDIPDAEYDALENAAEAAWDAYYEKEDEIEGALSDLEDAYDATQDRLEQDLAPLNEEMERLDALYAEAFDGQSFDMVFSVMAACPEISDLHGDVELSDAASEIEFTEQCVTTLENWADRVS